MNRKKELTNLDFLLTFAAFIGILYTRPGEGIDYLSNGSALFYFFVFMFTFLIVRWIK